MKKDNFSKIFWTSLIVLNLSIGILILFFCQMEKDHSVNQKEHSSLIGASYMTMNNEFYKI